MDNRFDRHALIPGWNQAKLRSSTIVIIGVGALGNEVARLLAMSGVGKLIICDFDKVEASNLSRCSLFRECHLGEFKVNAAASTLKELAPETSVEARSKPLVNGVGLAESRDASLVLSCLDSHSSRVQLAGRCNLVSTPYIDGGTHPWGGEVRLFLDPLGGCYACGLTPEVRATSNTPWSCLDTKSDPLVGAMAASSTLVSAWMALFSLRFLLDMPLPEGGLNIDSFGGTTKMLKTKRSPNCLLHSPILETRKIPIKPTNTVADLMQVLENNQTPLLWEPILSFAYCMNCEYKESPWGFLENIICPQCGKKLTQNTTIKLTDVPSSIILSSLGIPSCEILPVRTNNGIEYVELQG